MGYMNYLYKRKFHELARLKCIFRNSYYSYSKPLIESLLQSRIDKYTSYKEYHWEDAIKMTNYIDYLTRKITKYGLHYGFMNVYKFNNYKEKIESDEDELANYFLYEMRKKPVESNYEDMKM